MGKKEEEKDQDKAYPGVYMDLDQMGEQACWQWLDTLLSEAPDAFLVWDKRGLLFCGNEKAFSYLGLAPSSLGEPLAELIQISKTDDITLSFNDFYQKLRSEETMNLQSGSALITADGERIFVTGKAGVVSTEDEQPLVGYLFFSKSGKNDKDKLGDFLKKEYETVLDTVQSPVFVVTCDEQGFFRYRRVNPAEEAIAGRKEKDVVGLTPREAMGEEVGSQIEKRFIECAAKKEAITYKVERDYPEGRRSFRAVLTPLVIEDEVKGIVGSLHDITDVKALKESLQESEERHRIIFEKANDGIALIPMVYEGSSGRFMDVNETFADMTGFTKEELKAKKPTDLLAPGELGKSLQARANLAKHGEDVYELTLMKKDQSTFPVQINGQRIMIGEEECIISVIRDVTEQKKSQEEMAYRLVLEKAVAEVSEVLISYEEADFYKVLRILGEGVQVSRAYYFTYDEKDGVFSKAAEWCDEGIESRMLETQSLAGEDIGWCMSRFKKGQSVVISDMEKMPAEAEKDKNFMRRLGVRASLNMPVMTNGKFAGVLGFVMTDTPREWKEEDIQLLQTVTRIIGAYLKQRAYREKITYLSYYDNLTGLYNKVYFEEALNRLDTSRQLPMSIIMGDVNGLKLVNDAFGHEEGDILLVEVANCINKACRKEDIIARWGGDEFVIILPQTKIESAQQIIERIHGSLNETTRPIIRLTMAMGAAAKEEESQDIWKVFRQAEEAMYRVKIKESPSVRETIIESLQSRLNREGYETIEHWRRLETLSLDISALLDLSSTEKDHLRVLSYLHDIGKLTVPKGIILKKGPLTENEYEQMKKHTEAGYRIALSSPQINQIAELILTHHERWDGSGYPQGLAEEKIPYLSRIFTIMDSYDVMTHDQPYRKAMAKEKALTIISKEAGSHFDPFLAKTFVQMIEKKEQERNG